MVREFASCVGKRTRRPIDVLRVKKGGIALGRAGVPEEFVEVAAFVIVGPFAVTGTLVALCRGGFSCNNPTVFFQGDGALSAEDGFGPKQFG